MEHFYTSLGENWFDYQDLYSSMVNKFPDNSWFVEVGSWKGRSSAYMAVEIINSNKKIKFDCVDVWEYLDSQNDISKESFNSVYQIFLDGIAPVRNYINPIKATSKEASILYADESVDFIFIDAAHDYDNVLMDIKCWFPKVKKGGIIAGHDIGCAGVSKAVNEFFGNKKTQTKTCWVFEK